MQHKTAKIKSDMGSPTSPYPEHRRRLLMLLRALDNISQVVGCGEIVITDFLRIGDKWIHSLHHKNYGTAADIRVRDKPLWWFWMMVAIGKAIEAVDPKVRMNPHFKDYGEPNQHIHVEIRL